MQHKNVFLTLFSACLLISTYAQPVVTRRFSREAVLSGGLTPQELQVVSLINGTNAYNYDLQLEKIALNHSVSKYSFRAAGSLGANATANWIARQFENFGLETNLEPFNFTNWNMLSQPTLIIDDDGNSSTIDDQTTINSFQSEHYSWPTPPSGSFADLVVLPLPQASNYSEIGLRPIDPTAWNSINTTCKVLLIGREVRWDYNWQRTYKDKLNMQPPKAVIYTWWYDWMSFVPAFFSSAGGRPITPWGPYYWDLRIPVGFVNYQDGLWIRNRESSMNVFASVKIESAIGYGQHYNVIGKLSGHVDPNRMIIVSGHYDSVMSSGFCDNGAGTVGVIEMARVFTEAVRTSLYYPKYTIMFVAFASEEIGLVGSINYIIQHKAMMENITAVINLDCIGSDFLYVTRTDPGKGFDLDELILKAAQDLGMSAALEESGGSDQEAFRDPAWANYLYFSWWGLTAGIEDAVPINSSAMLISFPLLYNDKWFMGTPGWIHTPYDNSTSTQTLNWVEANDLQDHVRVAALSVMRIVHLIGDLNGDAIVDIFDLVMIAGAFGSRQGEPNWNPIPDLNGDGIVDIFDLVSAAVNFGKTYDY